MTRNALFFIISNILLVCFQNYSEAQTLKTKWFNDVKKDNPHAEYPRPQMVRPDWLSLNGSWDYSIESINSPKPEVWQGKILVPFPIESVLSGVTKALKPDQALWYSKSFSVPENWKGKQTLLHFEAVDWQTKVWVNGKYIGEHHGGYGSFSFDITEALASSKEQKLTVWVWDPTDAGFQPVGKQTLDPRNIWYTATSGIWQTVWLESVPKVSITGVVMTPDIDKSTLSLKVNGDANTSGYEVEAIAYDRDKVVGSIGGRLNESLTLNVKDQKLWSPETPFLYDLKISLSKDGQKIDQVSSYFGMRKTSIAKDSHGVQRMFLNNQPLFQFGPLDQGFWPDGLYTAPTEDAMKFDIQITKDMGFNMIRKHVKVEPKTWYSWCDRIGLLVWQDMPSGDEHIKPEEQDITRTAQSDLNFHTELKELIEEHYNYPSIVAWIPFNEGWGQFKTKEVVNFIESLDSTRMIDATTGWSDRKAGDMSDIHSYPGPDMPPLEQQRVAVLGEFGGQAYVDKNHLWLTDFSKAPNHYKTSTSQIELVKKYDELIMKLIALKDKGLTAAVYTQTTDVETEVNGLMTYDREVIKFDKAHMKQLHQPLYRASK